MRLSPRERLQTLAVLGGLAGSLVLAYTPFLHNAKTYVQDRFVEWQPVKRDPGFVLVGIDDASMIAEKAEPEEVADSRALQLIKAKDFPWSREVYALAIEKLLAAGARLIILDFAFSGPREGDEELAAAIRNSNGHVVIGSNFVVPKDAKGGNMGQILPPTKVLADAAGENVGYFSLPASRDSIIRVFWPYADALVFTGSETFSDKPQPALATRAAQILGYAPPLADRPELLRFRWLRRGLIPRVPLYEIFVPSLWERNLKGGAIFKDKVVLIGPVAEILQDIKQTPMGSKPGPEVHLNILAAMQGGNWLRDFNPAWAIPSVVLAAVVILILALTAHGKMQRFVTRWLLVVVGWTAFAWFALAFGSAFVPLTYPLAAFFLCGACALAADVSLERRERGRMRATLERYVSRDVVREIVDNPSSYLQSIGGKRKDIVILFSDLKGFTSDAEGMDPAVLVALLNEYFSEMVDAVFGNRGTLDKFIGDAIMATWGGLRDVTASEEARGALRAAFEMRDRLTALNARRALQGLPAWHSGIGLAQGPAVFGNLGSQQKMEPTVIGDTVNLASRIEGLTRSYDCYLLVNARVATEAAGECGFVFLDEVRVKGRKQSEKLYYPHRESLDWAAPFAEARDLYVSGKFDAARERFERLGTLAAPAGLVTLYTRRCMDFLASPPPEEWGGIWGFSEK